MSLDAGGVLATDEDLPVNISDEEKLSKIADHRIRAKVKQLKAAFENEDIDYLNDVLSVCKGCVDTAGNLLFGYLPYEFEVTVKRLRKNFPHASKIHTQAVLIEATGNFDDASQRLEEQLRNGKPSEYMKYARLASSEISSPPRTQQTSTTTTHVNGVVQSFVYRHDVTQTNENGEGPKTGNRVTVTRKSGCEVQNQNEKSEEMFKEEQELNEEQSEEPLLVASPKAKNKDVLTDEPPVVYDTFDIMAGRLYDMFGGRVDLTECENTLQSYENDIEEAFRELDGEYNILVDGHEDDVTEIGSHARRRVHRPDSGAAGFDQEGEKIREGGSMSKGRKRSAGSLEAASITKKPRVERVVAVASLSSEGDSSSFRLEAADEWIQKYYPQSKRAELLLGPNEVSRDTIPKKTLYDNSKHFKSLYDQQEKEGSIDETIKLRDVDPDIFDLAVQCLVTKSFRLPVDPIRSQSQDITVILDLVFLGIKLGFPDPRDVAIKHLREILIDKRAALRPVHVRRAYELLEDNPICYLFSQAVVRDYMMDKKNSKQGFERTTNDDSDSDIEEMNAARRSVYHAGFQFKKELSTIRNFKIDLFTAQDAVLASGEERIREAGTRRKPEITYTIYKDPLDDDKALEWEM